MGLSRRVMHKSLFSSAFKMRIDRLSLLHKVSRNPRFVPFRGFFFYFKWKRKIICGENFDRTQLKNI